MGRDQPLGWLQTRREWWGARRRRRGRASGIGARSSARRACIHMCCFEQGAAQTASKVAAGCSAVPAAHTAALHAKAACIPGHPPLNLLQAVADGGADS